MTSIRWLAGAVFIAIFLVAIFCNLIYVYRWQLHRQRGSLILLVGGVAGFLGFLTLPLPMLHRWFWVPILADFGIPYGVGLVLLVAMRHHR